MVENVEVLCTHIERDALGNPELTAQREIGLIDRVWIVGVQREATGAAPSAHTVQYWTDFGISHALF